LKKIIIIGAGGHSKVIVDIIKNEQKYEIAGFIDNNLPIGHKVLDYKVLGKEEEINTIINKHEIFGGIIAIGDNYIRCNVEKKIKELCNEFKFINCIHPKSHIAFNVVMGEGNVVMAGATINTSTEIGSQCILNTNCSIDHDNRIANFASIAPNAATGGNVVVGEFSAIGIGATVKHNVSIGYNCIIGSSSLVNKDAQSNSVYYGMPAKFIRNHELGKKYL
jgi:sugar O-acyltransferase (sialic acid O-acetyltransferase NeuD family)